MSSESMGADGLIGRAVAILRHGGLVAFPTETVYGLGADATNTAAVRRVFAAKGRPSTNPLIVHVADAHVARRYARDWPDVAQTLAERFWPGPLTLVLPKSDTIANEATAGLDSVGLRAPHHPLALRLLREFGGAVAAPSANRSNRVSPTTAAHVRRELGDTVDLIIDGGPCQVGIESTVLDLSGSRPAILRPGGISRQQIEELIGPIDLVNKGVARHEPAKSPGQQPVHYAPIAPAWRFTASQINQVEQLCREHPAEPATILSIAERHGDAARFKPAASPCRSAAPHRVVVMPPEAGEYARRLYAALHDADESGAAAIFIEMPSDEPEWSAVRDRIIRATREL
jgi:L-threonylcarbamoyladenylate synthase